MSTLRLPHCEQTSRRRGHWCLGTVPACLLGRIKFTPATTCFAPDHKPEMGRSSAFERHRRASIGLHLRRLICQKKSPGKWNRGLVRWGSGHGRNVARKDVIRVSAPLSNHEATVAESVLCSAAHNVVMRAGEGARARARAASSPGSPSVPQCVG